MEEAPSPNMKISPFMLARRAAVASSFWVEHWAWTSLAPTRTGSPGSSACPFPPVEARRSSKDAIATLDISAKVYARPLLDIASSPSTPRYKRFENEYTGLIGEARRPDGLLSDYLCVSRLRT